MAPRLLPALAALLLALPAPATPSEGTRRHVILFIGDGMSRSTEVATGRFLTGADDGLAWHRAGFGWQGWSSTWDVTTYDRHARARGVAPWRPGAADPAVGYDPARGGEAPWPASRRGDDRYLLDPLPLGAGPARVPATDSASAATALATGQKTDDGRIAWGPGDAGGPLATLAERARRERGAAVGLVTTVPFSHATPAAFVAHSRSREAHEAIAREIVAFAPEVVVGGGHPNGGPPGRRDLPRWLAAETLAALRRPGGGWRLVERGPGDGGEALQRAAETLRPGERLFGLFGGADGAFDAWRAGPGGALSRGSRQDPSLAAATVAALTVLSRSPAGFLLVVEQGDVDWAAHRGDLPWAVGAVADLDLAVRAAERFVDRPGDDLTWENTLLVVTADHANGHLRLGSSPGQGALPGPGQVAWGGPGGRPAGHTNELVTLAARGSRARLLGEEAGRWYPGSLIVDNTRIHAVLLGALGLR